ncbi:M64 family metallopeptidase, partial [uncultured Duncaniella sp.]
SYDDPAAGLYHKGVEPWEQNITTLTDFDSKWKDMLPPGVRIPTSPAESSSYPVGVYEGGGYQSRGVFRPANDCRMRTNTSPAFCPVCIRAIDRLIDFYVK